MVSTELESSDSAPLTQREVTEGLQAAEQFLRGITFSANIPPTADSGEERAMLESQFPGMMRLVLATRNRSILSIRGMQYEFMVHEGNLVLKSSGKRLPENLYRLARLRAEEAIAAVHKGHAEARKERGAANNVHQLGLKI